MLEEQNKNEIKKQSNVSEVSFSFKIILKFWKKQSINEDITLCESECVSISEFVKSVKAKHNILNAHCLEEIWIIQLKKEYDREIDWIKQIHGRIKLDIPQKYKDFLVRKANSEGKRPFEDPKF